MKAAVLTGAGQLEIREMPDPAAPPDGLVLEVKACGICGSDVRRWSEGPPAESEGIIPGHEAAGIVAEVGRNVGAFRAGDRLAIAPDIHCGRCYYCRQEMYNLCDDLRLVGITPGYAGGFAEKMVLSGEILARGIVHRMPENILFAEGALAEPCSSVLAAHEKAETGPGDTVVVLGGGPIGCIHVSVARARRARVILSEPDENRRRLSERFQPDQIVAPSREDVVARVRDLTDGRGADIVICANAVATTQTQAVEMVRKAGRVVLFGGLPKSSPMVLLDANRIHYGEIEIIGSFSYHPRFHEMALEWIGRRMIPSQSLITHRFALEQIEEAFETAASGKGLKVLVTMGKDVG